MTPPRDWQGLLFVLFCFESRSHATQASLKFTEAGLNSRSSCRPRPPPLLLYLIFSFYFRDWLHGIQASLEHILAIFKKDFVWVHVHRHMRRPEVGAGLSLPTYS